MFRGRRPSIHEKKPRLITGAFVLLAGNDSCHRERSEESAVHLHHHRSCGDSRLGCPAKRSEPPRIRRTLPSPKRDTRKHRRLRKFCVIASEVIHLAKRGQSRKSWNCCAPTPAICQNRRPILCLFLHIFRRFDRTPPNLTTHYACSCAPDVFHRPSSYPQCSRRNTSLFGPVLCPCGCGPIKMAGRRAARVST